MPSKQPALCNGATQRSKQKGGGGGGEAMGGVWMKGGCVGGVNVGGIHTVMNAQGPWG